MADDPRSPKDKLAKYRAKRSAERTHELVDATEAVLAGRRPNVEVTNPIGCNVKWKGKPAKWMPPEACDLV